MSDYNKYGMLGATIAVGLALTGVLWPERQSSVARGEDRVALAAARQERGLYGSAYNNADGAFVYTPNFYMPLDRLRVDAAPNWHLLYADTMVLARDQALLAGVNPLWLDASMTAPGAGDILAEIVTAWEEDSTYTSQDTTQHRMKTVHTALKDKFATSLSRMPVEGVVIEPKLPTHYYWNLHGGHDPVDDFAPNSLDPTNCPLVNYFYDGAPVANKTLDFYWPEGNWWSRIGNGHHLYKYWCESKQPPGEILDLIPTWAGFFTVTPNPLHWEFKTGSDSQEYTVTSTDSDMMQLRAAVVTVHATGKTDNRFVVSDAGSSPTPNVVLSDQTKTLTEGGSSTFTIHARDYPPNALYTVAFSCSEGFSVSPASVSIGRGNWDYNQTITVYCPENGGTENNAGVLTITFRGETTQMALYAPDNDGTPEDFITTPVLSILSKEGTADVAISLGHDLTNSVPVATTVCQVVKTNDLWDAYNVLKGMSRSAYVIGPGRITAITANLHVGFGDAYEYAPGGDVDDIAGQAFDNAVEEGVYSGMGYWQGTMISVSLSAAVDDTSSAADCVYTTMHLTGCKTPYPSEEACASGLVSKISIYMVLYDGEPDVRAERYLTASDVVTYTGDDACPQDSSSEVFGFTSYHVTPIQSASWDRNTESIMYAPIDGMPLYPKDVRLTLVSETVDPITRPTFDLGASSVPLPYGLWHGYDLTLNTGRNDWRELEHSIKISHFIIVVEWKWQIFGPTPYSPDSNIPPWASGIL